MRIVDGETTGAALVRDYLGRLHAAGWGLDLARREELVAEVREHIDEALRAEHETGRGGEAVVRNVLDRLGPPEEIVRAESEDQSYAVGAAPLFRPPAFGSPGNLAGPAAADGGATVWGPVEIIAVLMLSAGAVVMPIFGVVVGLVLVWVSAQWTRPQKLVATGLGLLPAAGLLTILLTGF